MSIERKLYHCVRKSCLQCATAHKQGFHCHICRDGRDRDQQTTLGGDPVKATFQQ